MIARRGFLTGLASALAAPAIVRVTSIMPVRAPKLLLRDTVYCNRTIRSWGDIEAMRIKNFGDDLCGNYRGVPIFLPHEPITLEFKPGVLGRTA